MTEPIKKNIARILIFSLFVGAVAFRLPFFNTPGGDLNTYRNAATDLLSGINPYIWTVKSYSDEVSAGHHGFAYLPLILYLNSLAFVLEMSLQVPFYVVAKLPNLIFDLAVGFFLFKYFWNRGNGEKKSLFPALLVTALWLFNPYILLRHDYNYTDAIPVLFTLLALYYLDLDDVASGTFLALSIASKPFAIILLPIFLIKSKNPIKLFSSSAIVGLFLSLPFMRSIKDFTTYLNGAIFVHTDRYVQGRPFLFFISYYLKVELVQIIPLKIYVWCSTILPLLFSTIVLFFKRNFDKYSLALGSLLIFYAFTPVLNRTHMLWALPLVPLAFSKYLNTKKSWVFYLSLFLYWGFYYAYMSIWKDGFDIWHP